MSRTLKFEFFAVFAMLGLNVAAYFFLVSPAGWIYTPSTNRCEVWPDYGAISAAAFAPIHWVDKKVIRPRMWSFPGTTNEYIHYMGWDS